MVLSRFSRKPLISYGINVDELGVVQRLIDQNLFSDC